MSDLRLRARSVTEIVDAAFQLYKRDALEYVLVTAVAYAPVVVAHEQLHGVDALFMVLDQTDAGFRITTMQLTVRGEVDGIGEDEFQAAAKQAKEGCPVSNALGGVEISLDASLA